MGTWDQIVSLVAGFYYLVQKADFNSDGVELSSDFKNG